MTMPDKGRRMILIFILILISSLNLFTNRDYIYPDIMEARNLITAREMVEKGNWLLPTMNNYPRLAKPPLPTWINAVVAQYRPVNDLASHRIPSALAALLMVLYIFGISELLSRKLLTSFITACIAATSFYLIFMGRQATWDIYCHALMTAAIYHLIRAWKSPGNTMLHHVLAGIFMGLSFLSKGPVAFYALLLPFLIAWLLFADRSVFRRFKKPLLLTLGIALAVGLAWPVYAWFHQPEAFAATMNREVTAWSDRHVRPFYHYWGFWFHIGGVWAVFALATLLIPKMKGKIERKDYYFLLSWIILMVVLLSIPSEKKERYLLPVLVPLSLIIGRYLTSVYVNWKKNQLIGYDRIVLAINSVIMIIVSIGMLAVLELKSSAGLMTMLFYASIALIFGFAQVKKRPDITFFAMILLMTSVSFTVLPNAGELIYHNQKFRSFAELNQTSEYSLPFYSENMNPKQILELGKPVDTIRVNQNQFILPKEMKFVLLTRDTISSSNFENDEVRLRLLDSIRYDPEKSDQIYFIYKVTRL